MRHILAIIVTLLVFPGLLSAQTPNADDLNMIPGGASRFITSDDRSSVPTDFDLVVSASDRLVNRLLSIGLKKAKPSPSGKKLKSMSISFGEQGVACVEGVFHNPASKQTKAADFEFKICCALSAENSKDVVFDIIEANVKLNGVEVFKSEREDPKPIGAVLDFLAPGIERAASEKLEKITEDIGKKLGEKRDVRVDEVMYIEENKVVICILPNVLSPLFPQVDVRHVGVRDGMVQLFLSFSEQAL